MNFNFLVLILVFLLASCGVKSPPRPPQNTQLPNYADQFLKPNHDALPSQTDEEIEEDDQ